MADLRYGGLQSRGSGTGSLPPTGGFVFSRTHSIESPPGLFIDTSEHYPFFYFLISSLFHFLELTLQVVLSK